MSHARLRVYHGPHGRPGTTEDVSQRPHTVTVPVGDVIPLLCDAIKKNRSWLKDFLQDEITISSDLYEVLLAYDHYRRPGA